MAWCVYKGRLRLYTKDGCSGLVRMQRTGAVAWCVYKGRVQWPGAYTTGAEVCIRTRPLHHDGLSDTTLVQRTFFATKYTRVIKQTQVVAVRTCASNNNGQSD